jgi:hypothetical protein
LTSIRSTVRVVKKSPKVTLTAPKLKFNDKTFEITVKGKMGSRVYIRERNGSKKKEWFYYGFILYKSGITARLSEFNPVKKYGKSEYFEVRLKDINGKYSKISKLKLTNYVPASESYQCE